MSILTIAIPTYNRADMLAECLESIRKQIDPEVEVLVCDNASDDSTGSLIESLRSSFPNLTYHRNEENIGPDGNFLQCLRMSTSEYTWLVSDDDILLDGAIARVISVLKTKAEISLAVVNYCGGFETLDQIPEKMVPVFPESDIFDASTDIVLERIGVHISFLSILIFSRTAFLSIQCPEQYLGTNLLQAHLALRAALSGGSAVLLGDMAIAARGGNSGGYELYQVFSRNWHRALFGTAVPHGLPHKVAKRIFSTTIADNLRYWTILMRLNPGKFRLNPWNLFPETLPYLSSWNRLYPVLLVPKFLLRAAARTRGLIP